MIGVSYIYQPPQPGLLIVRSAEAKRYLIEQAIVVGRKREVDCQIQDQTISKYHFKITRLHGRYWIEDLGSTNGTYVDGVRLTGLQALPSPAVIRAGQSVFVFHGHAGYLVDTPAKAYGFIGSFHVGSIIEECRRVARSLGGVLIQSANGLETQLAACAIAESAEQPSKSFLVFDALSAPSPKQARMDLLGTSPAGSEREGKGGLIEQAEGGVLNIAHVQALGHKLQQKLAEVIETHEVRRDGAKRAKKINVRFIFDCQTPPAADLIHRDLLKLLTVTYLPPLAERIADIPSIFNHLLRENLERSGIAAREVLALIEADHYEALMLDGFEEDNLHGIAEIASRIAEYILNGARPRLAITRVLKERGIYRSVAGRKRGELGPEHSDTVVPQTHGDEDTIC